MTTEQVPLAAQIEKVQREIGYARADPAARAERLWSAVLATLQQHERALETCAEAYQVVGALAHCTGTFDHSDVCRALDNLADPENPKHADLLPWPKEPIKSEQHERAMAVVEAALRFCMLNGREKAEAHKDLADAAMWFTPWQSALDDATSAATPAGKGETG